MKLSNKILIGFFGCIFLYLTAAFTELRVRGVSNLMNEENSKIESVEITGIRHLVVPDLKERVHVIGSDKSTLEVRSITGDLLQKLDYMIIGDRLVFSGLDIKEDEAIRITLNITPGSLQKITSNGAYLDISGLNLEKLKITQQNGWIRMVEKNQIETLDIEASQGYFDLKNITIDTLNLNLSNTEFRVESPVKYLDGVMSDSSYLRMFGVDQIHLKKDETSSIYLE